MPIESDPAYPAGRVPTREGAFVVEVEAAGGERGVLVGRVEHVQSGEAEQFESPEQLMAFVRGVFLARRSVAKSTPGMRKVALAAPLGRGLEE